MDWGEIIGMVIGGGIGSFGGPGTAAIGAGIGGGIGGGFGGDDEEYQFAEAPPPKFYEEPLFPEAETARVDWGKRIQEWGMDPDYGAISPDWGEIWEQAQKRVQQYYWGGPEGGAGIAGKVKASAARRGVSESPALETMMGRMGAMEAGELGDIATEQAVTRAEFGERGRGTWLENVRALSAMRKPGTWQGAQGYMPSAPSTPFGDIAEAGGSYLAKQGEQAWYEEMIDKMLKEKRGPQELPKTVRV